MIDCICSHKRTEHNKQYGFCVEYLRSPLDPDIDPCKCYKFRGNNLKYLEECYEKQNLG